MNKLTYEYDIALIKIDQALPNKTFNHLEIINSNSVELSHKIYTYGFPDLNNR